MATVPVNKTDRFRGCILVMFVGLVVASVWGWWVGKDPTQIAPTLGWVAAALGVGEASNVGKRFTHKGYLPGEDRI